MKNLLQNTYFDYCIKALMGGLLIWVIALMVEVRDFIKYKQPGIDEQQNIAIVTLTDNQRGCVELCDEKNENVNKRIDSQADKIGVFDTKLNLILFKLDMIKAEDLTSYNQN